MTIPRSKIVSSPSREAFPFVIIGAGTAGVRVAAEFWKLASDRHGFDYRRHDFKIGDGKGHAGIMFGPQNDGGISARTILVDLETSETSAVRSEFGIIPGQSIVEREGGGAKNYGDGRRAFESMKQEILESFNNIVGGLTNLRGLLSIHALGGGTGSGLGSNLTVAIRSIQKSTLIASAVILPDPENDPCRDPFASANTILALSDLLQFSDMVLLFDNYAIRRLLAEEAPRSTVRSRFGPLVKWVGLEEKKKENELHMYEVNNQIIADFLERMTSVFRFRSQQGFDWKETIMYSAPSKHDKLLIPMVFPILTEEIAEDSVSAATGCLDGAHHLLNCSLDQQEARSCVYIIDGKVNEDDIKVIKSETKKSCNLKSEKEVSVVPTRLEQQHKAIGILNSSAVSKRINDFIKQTESMLEDGVGLEWYEESGVSKKEIEEKLGFVKKVLQRYYSNVEIEKTSP